MLKLTAINLAIDFDNTTMTRTLYSNASDGAAAINAKIDELRASYGDGEWVGEGPDTAYLIREKMLLVVKFRVMRLMRCG